MSIPRFMQPRMVVGIIVSVLFTLTATADEGGIRTFRASIEKVTDWYEAVGSIRPRTESSIEAQVTAQVLDVKVRPGDKVQKGQILVSLDNRQLTSRLDQAKEGLNAAAAGEKQAMQGVAAARAAFNQAEANFNRTRKYFKSQAATSQQLEMAESDYLQARAILSQAREALIAADAGIRQAEEIIREAEIALGYTVITAPEDGEILRRLVEPGDLALPGKPLIIIQTASHLRMEAYVREGVIRKVGPGTQLSVYVSTLDKTLETVVEEIVPYADPQTRTFLVKSSLPPTPGLYPGMFGRLLIPVEEHEAVVIPEAAVRKVGQLELVSVREGGEWRCRYIQTGNRIQRHIEVLSGLSGGETIRIWEDE